MRSFASDNHSGAHPRVLEALTRANNGHAPAYGDDPVTARADALLREHFGAGTEPFFVFLGTAANVLSIRAAARSHHSVLCAASSHINVDECGAPEANAGVKLLAVPGRDGKITPEDVAGYLSDRGNPHHNQPRVLSITQCTELGTLYKPGEIRELADFAHANDLILHMDGARLCNAAAALDTNLAALTAEAGVDVLSFGGTKNGLLYGEAVIFFRTELARDFAYLRKQSMQLASKMRFIAAQFEALLSDGLWLENARRANAMARLLAEKIRDVPGLALTRPVQTNAVFARLPESAVEPLQRRYPFYVWNRETGEVRWMCSFDTTVEDVDGFVGAMRDIIGVRTPEGKAAPEG